MKFTGLIIICAASCLALILPAIGVVQFPVGGVAGVVSPNSQAPAQGGMFSGTNGSSTANAPFGLPVTTNNAPQGNSLLPQSIIPQATQLQAAMTDTTEKPINKIGLGIWLLLVPIGLVGFAMWTFGRNPSSSGK